MSRHLTSRLFGLLLTLLVCVTSLVAAPTARAASYPHPAPTGLKALSTSRTAVAVTWAAVDGAPRYRIKYSTSKSMKKPKYRNADTASAVIPGLKSGKTYYIAVRVISKNAKKSLSPYSAKIKVKTRSKGSAYTSVAPMGLKAGGAAADSVPLLWQAVSPGLTYRVEWSANASFSGSSSSYVEGTSTRLRGLKPQQTYYARVRVVSASHKNRSASSPTIKVGTKPYTAATPEGLSVSAGGPTSLVVKWHAVSGAGKYNVQYSTSSTLAGSTYRTVSGTEATLTGLAAATKYHVRVTVADAAGGSLSSASTLVAATTKPAAKANLRVASYNVHSVSRYGGLPNEGTWSERRTAVVATILGEKPDVIGLQEASQAQLGNKSTDVAQFDDLIKRLGSPYKLTNSHHYNCVRSVSPVKCESLYRGASGSNRIAYNATKLKLIAQGSKALSGAASFTTTRYFDWAILQDNASGRRFFFGNVHVEPGSSSKARSLRAKQMGEVLATIKAKNPGLPAYVVGDFNSHKFSEPDNAPYDAMQKAGFVDPLGNYYRSKTDARGATVQRRINTNCSSFNGFVRTDPCKTFLNGNYIDYIWTSKGISVGEWKTVVKLDSAGKLSGRIPSDHNLIRADTTIP